GNLVSGVASAASPRSVGRIGVRALVLFIVTLLVAAVLAALVAPALFALVPIDLVARDAMNASSAQSAKVAVETARGMPSVAQWVVDLVPANPVKAAADATMLPLILFSLLLGLAATRLTLERRERLLGFFKGLAAAALTLVQWVLKAAPLGVFCLTLP